MGLIEKKNRSSMDLEKLRHERREYHILKDIEDANYKEEMDINLVDKEEKIKKLKETNAKIEKYNAEKESDPTW